MKLGFWVAPEGSDAALSVVPLGDDDASGAGRASGVVSFLATSSGEQLIARCPRAAALLPQLAQALQKPGCRSARTPVRHNRLRARTISN